MLYSIQSKMIRHEVYFVLASLASISSAIRVDWNTNTGPIIPPVPTVRPVPQQPYRSPAPVWESAENDIPNPSPYHYLLPPPSRPRPATDNYLRAPVYPQQNFQFQAPQPNYGHFLSSNPNSLSNTAVPTLAVQYVPNKGLKYYAIAPSSGKIYYSKDTGVFDKYNKLNGKYNPKLKKHKAFEKKKYVNYAHYVPQQQQNDYRVPRSTQISPNYQATNQQTYFRPQNVWGSYVNSPR